MPALTRRELLTAAASASVISLGGCARSQRRATPDAHVSILKAPAYDQSVYPAMRRLLTEHLGDVRGLRVILKPNMVEFEPGSSINTNPIVVHAALEAFRAMGAASVVIAEGPGHRRDTLDLAEAAGYFRTVPHFEDNFVDLNLDETARIRPANQLSRIEKLYLPKTALGADLLVSMAKMKTHHWVGATLSLKNLFGVVPGGIYGWPKNVLHWGGIEESIADLHAVFPRQFAIVDGIVGMEGNGPIQGTPKSAGVIVAGRDPVAVDATCCRIMKIDPEKMRYVQLAAGVSNSPVAEAQIHQLGESVQNVATEFQVLHQFQHLRLGRV
jgi:uncharacterized protein (DUF362 family)